MNIIGDGIYTTTEVEGEWVVVLLRFPDTNPKEVSIKFPDEETAKAFMAVKEKDLSFSDNRAFMMAMQAMQMMS